MALPPTIANNTIVSNISGQTAAPAANTLTQLLDAILGASRAQHNHATRRIRGNVGRREHPARSCRFRLTCRIGGR